MQQLMALVERQLTKSMGDIVALAFSEAVGNESDLAAQITTIFGAAAVANWSDPQTHIYYPRK